MKKIAIILAAAALAFTACCSNDAKEAEAADPSEAVLANIFARKSVRTYTDQTVPDEMVETLLKAAMAAPTAMNSQPWSFVVLNSRETLDALAESLPYAKMLTQAPLAIVVCGQEKMESGMDNIFWQQDCAAATENLLLAAEALGLGAVWTGAYPGLERANAISEALGIPEGIEPMCVVVIGYPGGNDQPKDKWKPEKIHYGRW